jgi:hypothetical protein
MGFLFIVIPHVIKNNDNKPVFSCVKLVVNIKLVLKNYFKPK